MNLYFLFNFFRMIKVRALYATVYILLSNFYFDNSLSFLLSVIRQNNSYSFEIRIDKKCLCQKICHIWIVIKFLTYLVFANFLKCFETMLHYNSLCPYQYKGRNRTKLMTNCDVKHEWVQAFLMKPTQSISMILISNNDFRWYHLTNHIYLSLSL